MPLFSVAMCVYGKDDPDWFSAAVDSVLSQTVTSDDIVLVVDGPVPEALDKVVAECEQNPVFHVIRLEQNAGLGNALRIATEACRHEEIARMDSDDLALPERFENQLTFMNEHPDVDIVGGNIREFTDSVDHVRGYRNVPSAHDDIVSYIKTRCPFNHMTVMFKKSAVMKAGGYLDWHWNEDYYLWIRMHLAGCRFANLPQVLVNVRVGKDMYKRRGGMKYFKSEAALQRFMLKHHVIGFVTYASNVAKRLILQVLMPNGVREWVFTTLARSTENE